MPITGNMTSDEIAQACAKAMWEEDKTPEHFGMKIESVTSGTAVLSMTVTDNMTNGHGTCHGGFLFTLADTAFAYACNGHNNFAVAIHCSITYIAPGKQGDVLRATAAEVSRTGRNGIYDIAVHNQDGLHIAEFRGHSRTIKGTWLP